MPALGGNLEDFGIAEIFQLIGQQRKSGVLTLISGVRQSAGGDPMVRFSDEWRAWLEDELERLAIAELEQLARLVWAELLREDTTARMLVRCIDDTDPQPVFAGLSCPRRGTPLPSRQSPRRSGCCRR